MVTVKIKSLKKEFQILCLIFMFIAVSCDDEYKNANVVFAGKYDSTYIFHEFSKPLIVQTELDSATGFYSGRDSIDLNLDGDYDMIINLFTHPKDTAYQSGKEYFLPFCRLFFRNDFEVAMRGFQYACGHGICNYAPFVDAIEFDTDISHLPTWDAGEKNLTMWLITPMGSGYPPGWWYYVENKEMYIGIRQKQFGAKKSIYYKYGWIKVNAVSHQNTSYLSFAIEK